MSSIDTILVVLSASNDRAAHITTLCVSSSSLTTTECMVDSLLLWYKMYESSSRECGDWAGVVSVLTTRPVSSVRAEWRRLAGGLL